MKFLWLVIGSTAIASTACVSVVPAYDPVGAHTLKVGAEQEADVVWVQKLDEKEKRVQLYRCHNSPQGPQCVEAKTL